MHSFAAMAAGGHWAAELGLSADWRSQSGISAMGYGRFDPRLWSPN